MDFIICDSCKQIHEVDFTPEPGMSYVCTVSMESWFSAVSDGSIIGDSL